MNKIDKIRERINNKELEVKPKKNKILSFANFLLVLSFIGVSALTYCKIDEEATLIDGIFNTDYSFKEMNSKIDNYFDNLFNRDKEETDIVVSLTNDYISLGNNNYSTDDKTVGMLNDGVVVSINYHNEYKYFIVISYDNGVSAMYTLIDDTTIAINQKLKKNELIGSYNNDYFNCIFKKGEQIITYQDAL